MQASCLRRLSLLLVLGFAHDLAAAERYPKNVAPRLFGTDQWNTGSCWAHAKVQAVEQAYANLGSFVRLSPVHAHQYHYRNESDATRLAELKLRPMTSQEKAHLDRTGLLVPEYMAPEDEAGLRSMSRFAHGDFPGAKAYAYQKEIIDPAFKSIDQFGYKASDEFVSYGSSEGTIEALKTAIDANTPIALGIHGTLLNGSFFNEKTGMLSDAIPYSRTELEAELQRRGTNWSSGFNHAVALIGYDDNLYANHYGEAGKGAFIVRNSWNSTNAVNLTLKPRTEEENIEYAKFRGKFLGSNFPGYYAIPYAYVRDAIASRDYGYWRVRFDMSGFRQQYETLAPRYQIQNLPFACQDVTVSLNSSSQRQLARVRSRLLNYREAVENNEPASKVKEAMGEMGMRLNAAFGQARLVRYTSSAGAVTDQADAFYGSQNSDWTSYYCQNIGSESVIWPQGSALSAAKSEIQTISKSPNSPTAWYSLFDKLLPFEPLLPL